MPLDPIATLNFEMAAPQEAQPASIGKKLRSQELQEAIANIIRSMPRGIHLTASEVFRRAREAGLQVSLSTIYRVLAGLQAEGNVTTVTGDHGRRYEARDSDHDHDHLICVKCGLTVEFEDDLIRGFGAALAQRKGYEHQSSRFDIFGICSQCKSKDEDHRMEQSMYAAITAAAVAEQAVEKLKLAVALLESRKLARAQEAMSAAAERLNEALSETQSGQQSFPAKAPS